ncbi:hypothetical protein F7725_012055, partial [Dissostichus mawsoni]
KVRGHLIQNIDPLPAKVPISRNQRGRVHRVNRQDVSDSCGGQSLAVIEVRHSADVEAGVHQQHDCRHTQTHVIYETKKEERTGRHREDECVFALRLKMMEAPVCFLLLLSLALQPSDAAGPGSCVGRCGEVFTRGQQCTYQSCQGRCGETFSRGRVCECDAQCSQYSTCCHDYQLHCDAGVSGSLSRTAQPLRAAATGNRRPGRGWGDSNSESEEWYSARGPCSRYPRGQCPGSIRQLTASSSGRAPAAPTNQTQQAAVVSGPRQSLSGGSSEDHTTLGVFSPIDTVFTRCNCHAHTYIIKGDQFWRLDGNMVMEPGYPRPLTSEFPGLTGSIRAALAVPASRSSLESVYFFKSGDIMQRFSFPAGSAPSCSNTPSTPRRHASLARPVSIQHKCPSKGLLGAEVNIRVSLKGFPPPSPPPVPPSEAGAVRALRLLWTVHISGDLLVLTTPPPPAAPATPPILSPVVYSGFANMAAQNANTPPPANSIRAKPPLPMAPPLPPRKKVPENKCEEKALETTT